MSEATEKPKRLINGKLNPEYSRWHYAANTDKYKAATARHLEKKAIEKGDAIPVKQNQTRCIVCGKAEDKETSLLTGRRWKFFRGKGGHRAVCPDCR